MSSQGIASAWKITEKIQGNGKVTRAGLVAVTDGKVSPQSRRLIVTSECAILQKQTLHGGETPVSGSRPFPLDSKEREVIVVRQNGSGLGLSIKGGAEHGLPVFISRIFRDQAADLTGQLFVGDAIISVNGCRLKNSAHEKAVEALRNAGDVVTFVVKHYRASTPFLLKNARNVERCVEILQDYPCIRQEDGWENVVQLADSLCNSRRSSSPADVSQTSSCAGDSFWNDDSEWTDVVTVPLRFAYITRYIYGTDQMRRNTFEVRGAGGKSTGVITVLDPAALSQWMKYITDAIQAITNLEMALHNRMVPGAEQMAYVGWVHERVPVSNNIGKNVGNNGIFWSPALLVLRGDSLLFFQEPPANVTDWSVPVKKVSVLEVMFRPLRDSQYTDDRPNCFTLQIADGTGFQSHYMSSETRQDFLRFEHAWHRAMTSTAIRTGVKSFPVSCDGIPGALTLDWNDGLVFSAPGAEWSYKFSQLKGSSDNGKDILKLHFRQADGRGIEKKEITCNILHSLIYCMDSFMTAKVATIDPSLVKAETR